MKNHTHLRTAFKYISLLFICLITNKIYSQKIPNQCAGVFFIGGFGDTYSSTTHDATTRLPLYIMKRNEASFFFDIPLDQNNKQNVVGSKVVGEDTAACTVTPTATGGDTVLKVTGVDASSIDDNYNTNLATKDNYMGLPLIIKANSPSIFITNFKFQPMTTDIINNGAVSGGYSVTKKSYPILYRMAILDKTTNVFTWVTPQLSEYSDGQKIYSCIGINSNQIVNVSYTDSNGNATNQYELVPNHSYEIRFYVAKNTDAVNFKVKEETTTVTNNAVNYTAGNEIRTDNIIANGKIGKPNISGFFQSCMGSSYTGNQIKALVTDPVIPDSYQAIDKDLVTFFTKTSNLKLKIYNSAGEISDYTTNLPDGSYALLYVDVSRSPTKTTDCAASDPYYFQIGSDKTTTWNGSWSNGTPTKNSNVTLNADYITSTAPATTMPSFSACNLTLAAGKKLDINPNTYVEVQNKITNNNTTDDMLIVRSNGNLVQNFDGVTNDGGGMTFYRTATLIGPQYSYWSFPIKNISIKNIYEDGSTPLYTYYYNTLTNFFNYTWTSAVPVSIAIPGMGYAIRGSTTNSNVKVAGPYNNGRIEYINKTLNAANTGLVLGANNFNLVGNPYPSNLDLYQLLKGNSSVLDTQSALNYNLQPYSATYLFWDYTGNISLQQHGPQYTSLYPKHNYAVYNALSRTGVAAPFTTDTPTTVDDAKIPNGIVKPGQGFMVIAAKASPLVFSNSMRTYNSTNTVFFGDNTAKGVKRSQDLDRYWLKITSPVGLTNTSAIVYIDGANDGLDAYDTQTISSKGDNLYSIVDDNTLVINGRNTFNVKDEVNLGTSYFETGKYAISLYNAQGVFAEGQSVYLYDKVANIITDLQYQAYTFDVNAAGQETNRFSIIYDFPSKLSVVDDVKDLGVVVYKSGGEFVIKSHNEKIFRVEVYESSGRLVSIIKANNTEAHLPETQLSDGVYFLKININGKVVTKKIIQ